MMSDRIVFCWIATRPSLSHPPRPVAIALASMLSSATRSPIRLSGERVPPVPVGLAAVRFHPVQEPSCPRCILYLGADRFYYSVELLERPELREESRPVVIAHHPRAVVTTANDAARALGIGSAMSAAIALRRAPNALFLPPRHGLYAAHSDHPDAVSPSGEPARPAKLYRRSRVRL
ncbi:MAG: hypothetical protein FJ033_16525, partial [Chloroflexi bacterium]|nr:hypothetical protein [Chloroflexota bacterium]